MSLTRPLRLSIILLTHQPLSVYATPPPRHFTTATDSVLFGKVLPLVATIGQVRFWGGGLKT